MKEKVSVFTLGCKTNLYESRQLVSALRDAGFEAAEGLEKADIFIINTCAVTNEAERKSAAGGFALQKTQSRRADTRVRLRGSA